MTRPNQFESPNPARDCRFRRAILGTGFMFYTKPCSHRQKIFFDALRTPSREANTTKMKNISATLLLFALAGFFTPYFSAALAHHGVEDEAVIQMNENGFKPQKIEIKKGRTVTFKNTGKEDRWPASAIHPTHGVYPGSHISDCGAEGKKSMFDACGNIKPGGSWSFTFEYAGTWRMHDHLDAKLTGVIAVDGELNDGRGDERAAWPGLFRHLDHTVAKAADAVLTFFRELFRREELISENATSIFNDELSLRAYINGYGPMRTIKRLNELQPEFGDCHQQAHEAGRLSYEIYKEKVFKLCSAECHAGCYHGAIEAFFGAHGTKNLVDNIGLICDSEANPFESHQCFHGIGHGLTAWSDYEIIEMLKTCDLLSQGRESCYSGIFMENVVGGLARDEAGKTGKKFDGHFTKYLNGDPQYPCNAVEEKYRSACYFFQTSRMVQLFGSDFKRIAEECAMVPAQYRGLCFESMGRDIAPHHPGDPAGIVRDCYHAAQDSDRTLCVTGAVNDIIWDPTGGDEALKFCEFLKDKNEKSACYAALFYRAGQVFASNKDMAVFCDKAEPAYRKSCPEKIQ